jgi:tight adherence protein B
MTTIVAAVVGVWSVVALLRVGRRIESGTRLRRLAQPARWRLPARPRRWLERALEAAAVEVEPEGACELWLGTVLGVTTFAFAVAPGIAPIAALAALAGGPIGLRLARGRAQRRFVAALPAALEHVAAALRGGASVSEALSSLADSGGPLGADLRRLRARTTLGGGIGDALASWSEERDLASVRATAGALTLATTVGGPAAGAIDGLGASLRERLGAIAEAQALSAQARLSAIVVGIAPAAYFALSALVDPSSVGVLFATPAGRVCFGLGLVLEALAVVWMRRIVRTEEFA